MKEKVSYVRDRILSIAAVQFMAYALFGIFGFAGWIVAVNDGLGEGYVSGHLMRWTNKFPMWGAIILIASVLSLTAAYSLWKSKRTGAYLGVISFLIGFLTNLIVAQNLLVHASIGFLIGWTLLVPLIAAWKSLKP